MKKWMTLALVAVVVVVAVVALVSLSGRVKSAEENAGAVDLLYYGDGAALSVEIYAVSSKPSSKDVYDLGTSLKAELDDLAAEYEDVKAGKGSGFDWRYAAALESFVERRVELHDRIEKFLSGV